MKVHVCAKGYVPGQAGYEPESRAVSPVIDGVDPSVVRLRTNPPSENQSRRIDREAVSKRDEPTVRLALAPPC